jgi:hypothetical protein
LIDAAVSKEEGGGMRPAQQPPLDEEQNISAVINPSVAAAAALAADGETKKPKKKAAPPLTDDQVNYLKNWLFDPNHILNPYPTDYDKSIMERDTGIERKRLEAWFTKNRQRVLQPEVRRVKMKWTRVDHDHWVDYRKNRYMLEATADLLLMYANTNTFFLLEPFRQFDSTPIEGELRVLANIFWLLSLSIIHYILLLHDFDSVCAGTGKRSSSSFCLEF